MKHVGIVAVTAEGAALCYKTLCARAQEILGEHTHPEITIHSSSFHSILEAQRRDDWELVGESISRSLPTLEKSGADFVIVPANSVHFAYAQYSKTSAVPVWNLLELAADECSKRGCKKVLTLGVGITMSRGLFHQSLKSKGIESAVPSAEEQEILNKIIYSELVRGEILPSSTEAILNIVLSNLKGGVDGILLGCTELPLVLSESTCGVPTIDTTRLLGMRAAEYACSDNV